MERNVEIIEPEVSQLSGVVEKFIQTKHINSGEFSKFESAIKSVEEKRAYWALNSQLSPIQSVTVYGAYKAIFLSLGGFTAK